MQRNIVIFLIILILFILIAAIAYLIYYLQTRMAVGGTASSVSDMTENVTEKRYNKRKQEQKRHFYDAMTTVQHKTTHHRR
ncbi:hypothetical protein J4E86_005852 [Alternaria arbusti]|uniref:uncharacterized protein n=1 Tax=Alternaria arbusti TaxID=232088 RepID=UPI00221F79E0|nr:uncharacterized protein J4E86_005852 [Alternaria arbusti]KAI4954542.1 hypothetical protein J4E86_005852 [Alternaria arbusti]